MSEGSRQQLVDRHGLVIDGQTIAPLDEGWELARAEPGPPGVDPPTDLEWIPASVPGTVGSALSAGGVEVDAIGDLDASDWWFRCGFDGGPPTGETVLRLDGLATIAEVWVDGRHVLTSDNMFRRHEIPLDGIVGSGHELALGFRALRPLLVDRKPRPRWRTRIVRDQALRRYRTTIFGRAPGFAPGPAPVGPWRGVAVERRTMVAVERALLRPMLVGADGRLRVRLDVRAVADWLPQSGYVTVTAPGGGTTVGPLALTVAADGRVGVTGDITVPLVEPWWPHTHGDPALYDVQVTLEGQDGRLVIEGGNVGFRTIEADALERFALRVNGEAVFCRGGSLMPDRLLVDHREPQLRELLGRIRAAGMNMLRISGIAVYGDDLLYRVCDELGLLVWQDFAFANMDYPDDAEFSASVEAEAACFLEPIGRHASLAVLCGGSEIEQQATMMGVDPATAPGRLFETVLPSAIDAAAVTVPYVRSTPTGGALPIKPGVGVAHYYGVGAYRRPLDDARRANVQFAAECLGFSNVPDDDALAALPADALPVPHDAAWKQGVPRDNGATWDFEDVRDHYLGSLYGVDPVGLRTEDPDRYLALSRFVTGEIMAETLGEWRRASSSCAGALVWWLNDVLPGPGWGVIDSNGRPKPAYWIARRPLAPVAVWTTDEGTNGIAVHVANDSAERVDALLDVRLLRNAEQVVAHGERSLVLEPRTSSEDDVEAILGRFADPGYAYRFGAPQHDVVAVTLLVGGEAVSQTVRFPLGRRWRAEPIDRFGITAAAYGGDVRRIELRASRVAEGVRVVIPGFEPDDDWFVLVPGFPRTVSLRPVAAGSSSDRWNGTIAALNATGSVAIAASEA